MTVPELLIHGPSLAPARIELGEGAIWDERVQALYFIDILGCRLHRFTPGNSNHSYWSLASKPGLLVPTSDTDTLLVACQDGLHWFHLSTGQDEHTGWAPETDESHPNNRANDGKCDSSGRLVYGTMCMDESDAGKGKGTLYSVDHTGQFHPLLTNLSIPNGLGWSSDGTKFWHTDTPTRTVREFPYDSASGTIKETEGRIALNVPESWGHPDGATVDGDDHFVIASWGGGRVGVWDTNTGELLREVKLPNVSRVSSVAFGGDNLTDLYVTTAAPGQDFEFTGDESNAGSLFVIRKFGTGRPSNMFALKQ